jgi:hypothetical protein
LVLRVKFHYPPGKVGVGRRHNLKAEPGSTKPGDAAFFSA